MKPFLLINILIVFSFIYGEKSNKPFTKFILMKENTELATFGGGCFWCIEAVFSEVKGVISAASGYSGGTVRNPTYREVTTGATGHAEVVQITYDPSIISYDILLKIFFYVHDPTTLNRQGADIGTQYRSVIFYHNKSQKELTNSMIEMLNNEKIYEKKIVTQVLPLISFYRAEEYHQEYFNKNPEAGYCSFVIKPKMKKFRDEFASFLKSDL